MSSETRPEHSRTLAWRLTCWYAAVFAASSLVALSGAYFLIVAQVRERTDDDLREDVEELAELLDEEGIDGFAEQLRLDIQGDETEDEFVQLSSRDGSLALASDLDEFPGLPAPTETLLHSDAGAEPVLATHQLPGRDDDVRVASAAISTDYVLDVGESLED